MRKTEQLAAMCTLAVAAVATFTANAKTCMWTAQNGNWRLVLTDSGRKLKFGAMRGTQLLVK